ncbi:MAG: 2-hydroxyglutaryl-CoA dehydratase, partial [Clostridiales bacterium]|nr:2-hydroxyglutaryl-CoA dehydratase [Candidatus Blautia equi]
FLTQSSPKHSQFRKLCHEMVEAFDNIPITNERKPRVGIVGEILVKFAPAANNHLAELLEADGAEAVCPDLVDFLQYSLYNQNFKVENLGFKRKTSAIGNIGIKFIDWIRREANDALSASRHFSPAADIAKLAEMASPIVSAGNQTGEGWFLTGEMLELIHNECPNIVCIQPFGCLPNHIVGKGVIKEIRRSYPKANIVAIDYDPGASEVNQLNRIKLMLSTAVKNLSK